MAKQHQRHVGVFCPQLHGKIVDVVHQTIRSPARHGKSQVGFRGGGFSVPQMIVAEHQDASAGQIGGKFRIAPEIFAHAVRDLQQDLRIFALGTIAGQAGLAVT